MGSRHDADADGRDGPAKRSGDWEGRKRRGKDQAGSDREAAVAAGAGAAGVNVEECVRQVRQMRPYVKEWVRAERRRRNGAAGRLQRWWRASTAIFAARAILKGVAAAPAGVPRKPRPAGAYRRRRLLGNPLLPVVAELRRGVSSLQSEVNKQARAAAAARADAAAAQTAADRAEATSSELLARVARVEAEASAQREALAVLWEEVQRLGGGGGGGGLDGGMRSSMSGGGGGRWGRQSHPEAAETPSARPYRGRADHQRGFAADDGDEGALPATETWVSDWGDTSRLGSAADALYRGRD